MKTRIVAATLALTVAASAALADNGQLAASAGLSAAEAAGLGLHEIARHKFNADARGDDRIAVVVIEGNSAPGARAQLAAVAGLDLAEAATASLNEMAEAKIRAGARGDDRQPAVTAGEVSAAGRAQLAAASGLDPEVARSMTSHQIFLERIVRSSSDD